MRYFAHPLSVTVGESKDQGEDENCDDCEGFHEVSDGGKDPEAY